MTSSWRPHFQQSDLVRTDNTVVLAFRRILSRTDNTVVFAFRRILSRQPLIQLLHGYAFFGVKYLHCYMWQTSLWNAFYKVLLIDTHITKMYSGSARRWTSDGFVWSEMTLSILMLFNVSPASATYMHQWSGSALVQVMACSAPGHYLNQCCIIVNWTPGNEFQWNLNLNFIIFIHENAFEIVVSTRAAILSRGDELMHGAQNIATWNSTS